MDEEAKKVKNSINGFTKNQIFQLYDYLVAYEDSGIEKYKSVKALKSEHPELSLIEQVLIPIARYSAKPDEMKDLDFKSLRNEVYMTNNKGNLLLSLLAHLRNSIAHGDAVEQKGNVLITDFANPKYNPIDFTARGCVELSIINNITSFLKQIVL